MPPVQMVDAAFLLTVQTVLEQVSHNPIGSQTFSTSDHFFKYHCLEEMEA